MLFTNPDLAVGDDGLRCHRENGLEGRDRKIDVGVLTFLAFYLHVNPRLCFLPIDQDRHGGRAGHERQLPG